MPDFRRERRLMKVHQAFNTSGILFRVLSEIKIPESTVEIITTASSIPDQVARAIMWKLSGNLAIPASGCCSHNRGWKAP